MEVLYQLSYPGGTINFSGVLLGSGRGCGRRLRSHLAARELSRPLESDIGRQDEFDRLYRSGRQLALATAVEAAAEEQGDATRRGALAYRRQRLPGRTQLTAGEEQSGEVSDQALVLDLALLAAS